MDKAVQYILDNIEVIVLALIALFFIGERVIRALSTYKKLKKSLVDKEVKAATEKQDLAETLAMLQAGVDQINDKLDGQDSRLDKMEDRLDALTLSDMHDIKGWIVDQYHKFYVEKGWIDAFSADTIEHRYADYKKEGGNSYIDKLMERLRTLPMDDHDQDQE